MNFHIKHSFEMNMKPTPASALYVDEGFVGVQNRGKASDPTRKNTIILVNV